MEPSDPLYPFLLTLSYWEKSEEELGKWKDVRESRRVDNSQYDSVLGSYAKHRRQAHAYLNEVRRGAANLLPDEEAEMEELIQRLRKLGRDASKGRIKPDKANAESARIQEKLRPLQEAVVFHQTIMDTTSTDALGGRIVMSMDEYGVRIRKLGFRADPDVAERDSEEKEGRDIPYTMIAFILIVVAVIMFYPAVTGTVQMRFPVHTAGEQVVFTCINRGDTAAYFYAPWPEGVPDPQGMSPRGKSFGVRIHVREESLGSWHLLPSSEGAWILNQQKLLESGPFTIEAGARKVFRLNLSQLRSSEMDVDATRIQIVSGRGRVVQEKLIE